MDSSEHIRGHADPTDFAAPSFALSIVLKPEISAMISAVSGQRCSSETIYYVYEDHSIKRNRKLGDVDDIRNKDSLTGMSVS